MAIEPTGEMEEAFIDAAYGPHDQVTASVNAGLKAALAVCMTGPCPSSPPVFMGAGAFPRCSLPTGHTGDHLDRETGTRWWDRESRPDRECQVSGPFEVACSLEPDHDGEHIGHRVQYQAVQW